ncbi:MAG: hypothetical protein ACR2HJ_12315 [Fimbriimonadales bacterium]
MSHHVPALNPKRTPIGVGDSAVFILSLKEPADHADNFVVNFAPVDVTINQSSVAATVPPGGSVEVSTLVTSKTAPIGRVIASTVAFVGGVVKPATAYVDVTNGSDSLSRSS